MSNPNLPMPQEPNPHQPMQAQSVPPGWYRDPSGAPEPRWWDGRQWGPPQHAQFAAPQYAAPPVVVQQHYGVVVPKSVGVAFLLAFLFGPLGLLYASTAGGLIMLVVSFFAFFLSFVTFGLTGLLSWITCIIWACVAANSHNERIRSGYMR